MDRQKIEKREQLSYIKKDVMANKSNNRCCHCGKKISFNHLPHTDKATVEHFVPLIRGGTNDIENLVSLCLNCNKDKGSFIYQPSDYLLYLQKKYLEEVEEYFDNFIHSFEFVNKHNLFACDIYKVRYCHLSHNMLLRIKNPKRRQKLIDKSSSDVWYKKATYKDIDKLAVVLQRRLEKMADKKNIHSEKAASEYIKLWLDYGCIYYSVLNGEINTMSAVIIRKDSENNDLINHYISVTNVSLYNNDSSLSMLDAFSRMIPKIIVREQHLTQIPVEQYYPGTPIENNNFIYYIDGNDKSIKPKDDENLIKFFDKFDIADNSEYDIKLRAIAHIR